MTLIMNDKTSVLNVIWDGQNIELYEPNKPVLFVCTGRIIKDFPLHGHQLFGRSSEMNEHDILVANRFISRKHGYFDTAEGHTLYTALETTNGIMYRGNYLEPMQSVLLRDGDELIVPDAGEDSNDCVMLIYADSKMRINMWHELQQTSRDRLTGLYNREGFLDWWKEHHRSRDYDQAALFILDVDDFKHINDEKGHNVGDDVLQLVADCLSDAVRYEHQVCRWGGDEFVGVVPGSQEKVISRLKNLSQRIEDQSKSIGTPVSVSVGAVDIHQTNDVMDVNGLINLADQAMYSVKNKGKRGVALYEAKQDS